MALCHSRLMKIRVTMPDGKTHDLVITKAKLEKMLSTDEGRKIIWQIVNGYIEIIR